MGIVVAAESKGVAASFWLGSIGGVGGFII
jgi:hypothetical protein